MCTMSAAMRPPPLASRPLPSRVISVHVPSVAVRPVAPRGSLVIVAAQNTIRRQRTAARDTAYNKHYMNLVKSSSRAVLKGYKSMMSNVAAVAAEADLKPVDDKLSVAFSSIDKAVSKGILHKKTAARRKMKLTNARKQVLVGAGLYTPQ